MGPVASEVTSTTRSGVAASTSVAVGQSTEAEATAVSSLRATAGSSEALIATTLRSSPQVPCWIDTSSWTRTRAPGSRSPRVHRTADPTMQGGGGKTTVTPAGSGLETTTSCAVAAPLFRATSVHVNDVAGPSEPADTAVARVTSGVATSAPATDVVHASPTSRAPTAVATRPIRRDLACRTSLTPPHRVASSPPGAGPQRTGRAAADASTARTRCAGSHLLGSIRSQADHPDATTSG